MSVVIGPQTFVIGKMIVKIVIVPKLTQQQHHRSTRRSQLRASETSLTHLYQPTYRFYRQM